MFHGNIEDINEDVKCETNKAHHQLIIAMSANSDYVSRTQSLEAGADYFIPKPFKLDMFYDALQSCWEAQTS